LELETQVSSAFGGGSLTNELEKELKRAEKKVSELNLVNTELIQRLNSANGKLDSEKISKQNMATNVKEVTRQLKKQNNIIPTLASEKTSNKMKTKVNAKKRPFKVLRSRSR